MDIQNSVTLIEDRVYLTSKKDEICAKHHLEMFDH